MQHGTIQHGSSEFTSTAMAGHPDLVALREKYAQRSSSGTAVTVLGLTFLAGLYAAISPWVVGFDGQSTLAASNLIVGIAAAVLALTFAAAYERTHGIAWVTPLLGVWLIITPFFVSGVVTSTAMLWSNIVVGACLVVLGLAATGMGLVRISRAGDL